MNNKGKSSGVVLVLILIIGLVIAFFILRQSDPLGIEGTDAEQNQAAVELAEGTAASTNQQSQQNQQSQNQTVTWEEYEKTRDEARNQEKVDIAVRMIEDGILPQKKIAEYTGLPLKKVQELAK